MGDLGLLRDRLSALDRVVVAFSGGADSAFLAWVAHDTLGPSRALAVTAVSPLARESPIASARRRYHGSPAAAEERDRSAARGTSGDAILLASEYRPPSRGAQHRGIFR